MSDVATEPRRRLLRPGELYAVDSRAVQQDGPAAFFWLFGPPIFKNERIGTVCVVRISGPLEYHDDGCGDSYECIVDRVTDAMAGGTDGDDDTDDQYPPPSAVVLRIDSPGGVVAGLGETIKRLRGLSKATGIPLIAYVDETAYSAGYGLCCACDEIYLPRSGFCGSIGVISTLVDQVAADEKMGLKFVVITSGERKADGHPHVPITDAMVDEERPRVDTLAMQFFKVVNRARGLSIDTIRGFQASRFLGKEAVRAGVADGIMGWDELIETLDKTPADQKALAQPGTTVPNSHGTPKKADTEANTMPLNIDAMIARTEKRMTSEKDPKKLAALAVNLEAYKKTKTHIEKHETEEGADEDEDEDEEEAAGDETDREETSDKDKDTDDDGDDGDDDDSEDDDEEDEEEESEASMSEEEEESAKSAALNVVSAASAAGVTSNTARKAIRQAVKAAVLSALSSSRAAKVYAVARRITGKRSVAAIEATLRGMQVAIKDSKSRLAQAQKDANRARRSSLVSEALQQKRISPAEAKVLQTKRLSFVEQTLAMKQSPIVYGSDGDAPIAPMTAGTVPASAQEMIDKMVAEAAKRGVKLDAKQIATDVAARGVQNGRVL